MQQEQRLPRQHAAPAALPNQRGTFNLIYALVIATMVACAMVAISGVLVRLVPTWQSAYLVGACFVVALEAAFVQYTIRRERMWFAESLRYLVAEVALLLVVMRVVATLSQGLTTLRESVAVWVQMPLEAVDGVFIGCVFVGLLVGAVARNAAHDLNELEPSPLDYALGNDTDSRFYRQETEDTRREALSRFGSGFTWGGVAIVVAMVIQVLDFDQINVAAYTLSPLVGFAGLAYLVCGFWLYSQAQLALLRTRWHLDGADVDPAVTRRWSVWGTAIVVGIALMTLLLPRSYGLELLDVFRGGVGTVLVVLNALLFQFSLLLIGIFGLLIALPAMLLAALFPANATGDTAPPAEPPPLPAAPPAALDPPLLPALIFWVCVALLAGYVFWTVARRHGWFKYAGDYLRNSVFGRLLSNLGLFWHDVQAYSQQAAVIQAERKQAAAVHPQSQGRWPRLRLSSLAPGELVRYFYLSVLQRAAQRGVQRQPAQTPHEYGRVLTEHVPEAQPDIDTLTDAFVATLYAPAPPDADTAAAVRKPWSRLTRLLRRQR